MSNDLIAPEDLHYKVDYTKPVITFQYFDEFKANVQGYADRFSNMVVNEDTVRDAKEIRAQLNKAKSQIDTRRKEIAADYKQPLKKFEAQVKEVIGVIDGAIKPIDDAVKTLDAQEKANRKKRLDDKIAEIAPSYKINPSEITYSDTWLAKAMFKNDGKGEPTVKLIRAIGEACTTVMNQHERITADKAATEAYAKQNGLEPSGWLNQIEQGSTFVELRTRIDDELMRRKQEADKEQKRQEAAAAVAKMKQQQTPTGTTYDSETGELVDPGEDPQADQTSFDMGTVKPKIYRRGLMVVGTREDLQKVANFMKANNIEFHSIEN